jgi:hypothetical protein
MSAAHRELLSSDHTGLGHIQADAGAELVLLRKRKLPIAASSLCRKPERNG